MWEGINRRKFPRANYKCNITLRTSEKTPKTIRTHTENIGMGGICVIIKEGFELFKTVELEVTLEDSGPPIRCKGSVVWVVKKSDPASEITYDTGIEFGNIKEADRDRVEQIVKKILAPSQ